MYKLFYLVRHGETEWNHSLRYQGKVDVPLSKVGRNQALKLAERIKHLNIKFKSVYTSPLLRSKETAFTICDMLGCEVITDDRLKEFNFGEWEGKSVSEVYEIYGDLRDRWMENPNLWCPKGAERASDVMSRVSSFIADILNDGEKEARYLIVSHGGAIRAIAASILGFNISLFWSLRLDNTSLSIISIYNAKPQLILWNDVSHLESNLPKH